MQSQQLHVPSSADCVRTGAWHYAPEQVRLSLGPIQQDNWAEFPPVAGQACAVSRLRYQLPHLAPVLDRKPMHAGGLAAAGTGGGPDLCTDPVWHGR